MGLKEQPRKAREWTLDRDTAPAIVIEGPCLNYNETVHIREVLPMSQEREEQIKEASQKYWDRFDADRPRHARMIFEAGAKWADENPKTWSEG